MLQAARDTRLKWRQPDNITLHQSIASIQAWEFNKYVLMFIFYAIGDRSAQFVRRVLHYMMVTVNSFTKLLNLPQWSIYIYIYIYIYIERERERGRNSLSKHVCLNNADCFFFKNLRMKTSNATYKFSYFWVKLIKKESYISPSVCFFFKSSSEDIQGFSLVF